MSREKLLERIEAARAHKPIGRQVVYGTAGIEEVQCKCCSSPLRKMIPDDRFQEVREINGQRVVCERLTLGTLPSYTEVLITFDDGSKHVSAICKQCGDELTLADIEWMYCCDLNEWLLDGSNASDGFWEAQLRRTPVSFKVFPPGEIAS